MAEELFNFITLRQPETISGKKTAIQYLKDLRKQEDKSYYEKFLNARSLRDKLVLARSFISSDRFFEHSQFYTQGFEDLAKELDIEVKSGKLLQDGSKSRGSKLIDIVTNLETQFPFLKESNFFNSETISNDVKERLMKPYGQIWDTLYSKTILGLVQQTETNYLVDAIRVLHVLNVVRFENLKEPKPDYWNYLDFRDYQTIIAPEFLISETII